MRMLFNMATIHANHATKPVTHYTVHMELQEPTTPINANDANARIHAVNISVQMIPNVPLICKRTHNRVRRLCQSVERVRIISFNNFVVLFPVSVCNVFFLTVNKSGECPRLGNSSRCDRECYTDADCRDDNKCCEAGCGFVCVSPEDHGTLISTAAPPHRPHHPEGDQTPAAPSLVEKPREELDVVQTEGGVATLRCFATGYPLPTVTWRRGSIVVCALPLHLILLVKFWDKLKFNFSFL